MVVEIFDEVGIEVLLVGDFVVNNVFGYEMIVFVIIDEMLLLVCVVVCSV